MQTRPYSITVPVLALLAAAPLAAQGDDFDSFPILVQLNKAQLVVLSEAGLLPGPQVREIARGIRRIAADPGGLGGKRSGDYLVFEKQLVELVGPNGSKLHMGRSRIDMGAR